jgi:hypothetical protein
MRTPNERLSTRNAINVPGECSCGDLRIWIAECAGVEEATYAAGRDPQQSAYKHQNDTTARLKPIRKSTRATKTMLAQVNTAKIR